MIDNFNVTLILQLLFVFNLINFIYFKGENMLLNLNKKKKKMLITDLIVFVRESIGEKLLEGAFIKQFIK